jgi:hypothetical protein
MLQGWSPTLWVTCSSLTIPLGTPCRTPLTLGKAIQDGYQRFPTDFDAKLEEHLDELLSFLFDAAKEGVANDEGFVSTVSLIIQFSIMEIAEEMFRLGASLGKGIRYGYQTWPSSFDGKLKEVDPMIRQTLNG